MNIPLAERLSSSETELMTQSKTDENKTYHGHGQRLTSSSRNGRERIRSNEISHYRRERYYSSDDRESVHRDTCPPIRPIAQSTPRRRQSRDDDRTHSVRYSSRGDRDDRSYPSPSRYRRRRPSRRSDSRDNRVEQIRKWNVTYDGSKNLLEFLERVEELSATYGIPDDEFVSSVPMLLREKAILWYRNNRRTWRTWTEFKDDICDYFLPVDIQRQLEEDIRNRTQGPKENARDSVTALQTLIRRYGRMSIHSELDRVYNNLRPEYRRYIRRREVKSVNELIRLASEYEMMLVQEKMYKSPPSTITESENLKPKEIRKNFLAGIRNKINSPYVRNECCWRCGQRGHRRIECRNPAKLFCSWCGQLDTINVNCKCPE